MAPLDHAFATGLANEEKSIVTTTTEHNLFHYPFPSFTNTQIPLFRVVALYFDKLFLLDLVVRAGPIIGADHHGREIVVKLQEAGDLRMVTPADVPAKYVDPITDTICRDMHNWETLSTKKMIAGSFWDTRVCRQATKIATIEGTAVQKGYETWLI